MFKQKQIGAEPFGAQDQELVKTKPLSVQGPDVHESLKLAGVKDLALDSKNRRRRLLCCCGVSGCQIGPMTQVQEEGK